MDILKIEIFSDDIQIRYDDGSREEVSSGIYERKNTRNKTVEERLASPADIARLTALAETYEASIKPLDATIVRVQIVGSDIDIYYDDGRKESIDLGVYEIKDANNDTIFERTATAADTARLSGLTPGETGSGTPSSSGPIAIDGTAGEDDLRGTDAADEVNGGDGDDKARGRGGDDIVNGDAGDDRVRGDSGDDTVSGGDGNDRVKGDAGNDFVSGGDGNDIVKGNLGDDIVNGDDGDDKVNGDQGNDIVSGGNGDDLVKGDSGDDVLNGDAGSDVYDGGIGADTFVFEMDGALDRIKDFEDGIDLIDISAFGIADAAALSMEQSGRRVIIDLGDGDLIRIDNTTMDQLTDADFIF